MWTECVAFLLWVFFVLPPPPPKLINRFNWGMFFPAHCFGSSELNQMWYHLLWSTHWFYRSIGANRVALSHINDIKSCSIGNHMVPFRRIIHASPKLLMNFFGGEIMPWFCIVEWRELCYRKLGISVLVFNYYLLSLISMFPSRSSMLLKVPEDVASLLIYCMICCYEASNCMRAQNNYFHPYGWDDKHHFSCSLNHM